MSNGFIVGVCEVHDWVDTLKETGKAAYTRDTNTYDTWIYVALMIPK